MVIIFDDCAAELLEAGRWLVIARRDGNDDPDGDRGEVTLGVGLRPWEVAADRAELHHLAQQALHGIEG